MVAGKVAAALVRVHVGEGIFYPRLSGALPIALNPMVMIRSQYEESGGFFVVHDKPGRNLSGSLVNGTSTPQIS